MAPPSSFTTLAPYQPPDGPNWRFVLTRIVNLKLFCHRDTSLQRRTQDPLLSAPRPIGLAGLCFGVHLLPPCDFQVEQDKLIRGRLGRLEPPAIPRRLRPLEAQAAARLQVPPRPGRSPGATPEAALQRAAAAIWAWAVAPASVGLRRAHEPGLAITRRCGACGLRWAPVAAEGRATP